MELVTIICHGCEGKGKRDYGMVAEGMYPNISEWYKGIDICDICGGEGKIKELHPKYF